jgi:aldose 1-epimerase
MKHNTIVAFSVAALLAGCQGAPQQDKGKSEAISEQNWGTADGKEVKLFTLTNASGMEVKITNYGGIVTSWKAPDRQGNMANIVVGFDSLAPYLAKPAPPYFGALIGRYGNRIGNATFMLDGVQYKLAANNGINHLHGGNKGFDKVVWGATPATDGTASLTLSYLSPDGEEGYPGNLQVSVKYSLTDAGQLLIDYTATTDKPTPVNLTNHCYFNLGGSLGTSILNPNLQIHAAKYTPVDSGLIPTGLQTPVAGTPFDFTQPHTIGERIADVPGGYDHNFVLSRNGNDMELVATLSDSASGRVLEVLTTEPGLQFYSGNFLDGSIKTSDGIALQKHAALCLETQHFPDSPNKPEWPSTILRPGQTYKTTTIYKITVVK